MGLGCLASQGLAHADSGGRAEASIEPGSAVAVCRFSIPIATGLLIGEFTADTSVAVGA